MKIVLLNGPPRAGKDTLAKELHLDHPTNGHIVKFAEPIKRIVTAGFFGGDRAKFDYYDTPELKDTPIAECFGKTLRQVQISTSEDWLKPLYGQDIFGLMLVTEINRIRTRLGDDQEFYVSDSGFKPEAEVLIKFLGPENIKLVRIHREGFTYSGDSRSYINLDEHGVPSLDLTNVTGQPQETYTQLRKWLGA